MIISGFCLRFNIIVTERVDTAFDNWSKRGVAVDVQSVGCTYWVWGEISSLRLVCYKPDAQPDRLAIMSLIKINKLNNQCGMLNICQLLHCSYEHMPYICNAEYLIFIVLHMNVIKEFLGIMEMLYAFTCTYLLDKSRECDSILLTGVAVTMMLAYVVWNLYKVVFKTKEIPKWNLVLSWLVIFAGIALLVSRFYFNV